jgi:hypothetical protein
MMKSRIVRWTGHVACMGARRATYSVLVGKPEGSRPVERPRRDGKIILKSIFQK